MRISDWSSDVCSSDLLVVQAAQRRMIAPADLAGDEEHAGVPRCRLQRHRRVEGEVFDSGQAIFPHDRVDCGGGGNRQPRDRKSVAEGKSVSVGVEFGGGRRSEQKKTKKTNITN